MYLQIKRATMALCLSLFCFVAFAQKTVTGTVKDATGEPLIGATVAVGETAGAVTDIDGNFTISNVPENATLNISYIGYKSKQIKVGNQTKFNIVLDSNDKSLDEVVVVGYGQMKKSDLTGSIASIKTEQLTSKGTTGALEALQGAVPGVNITQSSSRAGGGFDIQIRGKSTMGSNNTPLYVVDGIICSDIDFLNPQDIEQIDVLKDASSTAIYGSRATNGVVIVTTKSAKEQGKKNSKPTISYDGYYGFKITTRMPDFMSGSDFLKYRTSRYLTLKTGTTFGAQPVYELTPGSYATAYLTANDDPTGESYIQNVINSGREADWVGAVTHNAAQQNHYLSVSGNAGKTNYHFGIGYQQEGGIYKNDDMKRYNFKGTVDTQINDYFTAGISFNAANTINKTVDDEAISNAFRLNALCLPYDTDGNLIQTPGMSKYLGTQSNQFTSTWNPLFDFENSEFNTKSWHALANIYLEYKPMKNLSFKTTFAPSYFSSRLGEFEDSETSARSGKDNYAYTKNTTSFSWTWDNQVNYSLRAGDHSLNLMGLFSASSYNQEYSQIEAYAVPAQTKWYHLGQSSSTSNLFDTNYTEWSMLSYALRANYSYLDRYMFTGTVRWDGSSRFAKGNRWGSFPSAAVAWRISEEPFMEKTKNYLSNLKLRLSFGTTGNNNVGNYATDVTASGGTIFYGFADGTGNIPYYQSGIVNRDLTWEITTEYNAGLDFGFFNNRITGAIDLYTKTSKDLLMNRTLAYEAGGATIVDNIGKVRNKGIEISLNTVNITNKDWYWSTSFSFAHNKNEILEVNGGTKDDIANGWFVGKSINALYNWEWNGIVSDKNITVPNTQIAIDKGFTPGQSVKSCDYYYACYGWSEGMPIITDLDGNGTINADDKKIIGKNDPSWTGSFNTQLRYKDWDFSLSLYTKQNYEVYSPFYAQYMAYGDRGMQHANFDYYIPAGTLISLDGYDANGNMINPVYQETTHYGSWPFPTGASQNNSGAGTIFGGSNAKTAKTPFTVVDGSYWKVKNIVLGYTVPKSLLSKLKIQSLRLYVNVTNPFVFGTDYLGFDPEWCGSSMSENGPSSITWQIGANLKF